jgi:hypothetical protein
MSKDDHDDLVDEFWERVADWDQQEEQSFFAVLPAAGVALPAPEELDDAQLTAKLWEVINALALLGAFLENTNHLSDRELYTHLWSDLLREPVVLMPENPAYGIHLDLVGSGSEEHTLLAFKYYAGEEERRSWLREWPTYSMPEHEDPPFDRDRHLPKRDWRADSKIEPVM